MRPRAGSPPFSFERLAGYSQGATAREPTSKGPTRDAEDRSKVSIFNSVASSNVNNGILAASTAAAAEINVSNSVISNNSLNGINVSGAASIIRIANVSIFDNGTGIFLNGGTVTSFSPATNSNAGICRG